MLFNAATVTKPTQESPSIAFLQWALPRVGLTWSGFRRVHRQVWRRIAQRMAALHLGAPNEYRAYLEGHSEEWPLFESFCRVTISRFMRDAAVFERIGSDVLPFLADAARSRGDHELRVWSAGCASGEEPYSIVLLWHFRLREQFPDVALSVTATDVDEALLQRARAARYRKGSLRELPTAWAEAAFVRKNRDEFELQADFSSRVDFACADVRRELPHGVFDIILCRNLVCTYFDERSSRETLTRMLSILRPGGAFVIGRKEVLPSGLAGVREWDRSLGIFRRIGIGGGALASAGAVLCA